MLTIEIPTTLATRTTMTVEGPSLETLCNLAIVEACASETHMERDAAALPSYDLRARFAGALVRATPSERAAIVAGYGTHGRLRLA